jgi:endonuclease-3
MRVRYLCDRVIEYYWSRINPQNFTALTAPRDPYYILIATILSQNTSDVNSSRALARLIEVVGVPVDVGKILELGVERLAELIRVSGLHYAKARTILQLLRSLSRDELEYDEPELLRTKLLKIPGIGYKTADVFLLMYRNHPIFPIDTHIRRVLHRYGTVDLRENYERARRRVEEELPREANYLLKAHLSLIQHGRSTCKARKPLCNTCIVNPECLKRL